MNKIEYKYLVSNRLLASFRKALLPYVIWDKYSDMCADKHYTVKTIYFDTSRLDFYQEKLSGLKRRKKIRIRGYNEATPDVLIYLEIKRKDGQIISKSRAPLPYEYLSATLLNNGIEKYIIRDNENENLKNGTSFLYHLRSQNLIPTIKVIYEREAYFARMNPSLRITLDSNLRSSLQVEFERFFEDRNMIYALPTRSILEIKTSAGFPFWLQQLIGSKGLQLQALSKYTICMETHTRYEHQLHRSMTSHSKFDTFRHKTKLIG